jgi:phosphonate transport system substrate-binding protein
VNRATPGALIKQFRHACSAAQGSFRFQADAAKFLYWQPPICDGCFNNFLQGERWLMNILAANNTVRQKLTWCVFVWSLIWLIIGDGATQTAGSAETKAIHLGLVSEINKSAIEEHFRDFVRYVTRRIAPGSEADDKVIIAPTPFELAKVLEQRRVDYYFESVYPTYTINYVHGAGKTILRRWKGGAAEYQSLIFTKRDGGIKQLGDLRGKMIIFEDPGSTSGYLMPKLFLSRNGLKMVEKKNYDPNALPTDVQYSFAYLRSKLIEAVLTKQVAAGAISDDDYNGLDEKRKSQITILAQTEKLPRHLVSVRADLDPQIVAKLTDLLVAMHDDVEGQRILKKTDETSKFDPLPGGEAALRKRLLDSFYTSDRR